MSEFSSSYHLLTDDSNAGKQLLQFAKLNGYVFPSHQNWVTLLPEGEIFESNIKLIEVNKGILLHYVYAEDHEWSVGIYREKNLIFFYHCDWNQPNLIINDKKFEFEVFKEIVNEDNYVELEKYKDSIFFPESRDHLSIDGYSIVYKFADIIGLKHYQWLSYYTIKKDAENDPNVLNERGCEYQENDK